MPTNAEERVNVAGEHKQPGSAGGTDGGGVEQDTAAPRIEVLYAVIFTAGFVLAAVAALAALVWAPLLWCVAAGFILITVSFTIRAGRF